MALASLSQDSFNAGIVREFEGQRIPPNGLYDVVNGLLDDDQAVYRRGGDAYFSASNASVAPLALTDEAFSAGQRTVMWDARHLYTLDGSSNPVLLATAGSDTFRTGRSVMYFGMLVIPPVSTNLGVYGGSLKNTSYSTGSVNLTAGSASVTGNTTVWAANVDAGMVFTSSATGSPMVVQDVVSNTSLTLREPSPVTAASALYSLQPSNTFGGSAALFSDANAGVPTFVGVAGTRLLQATGNRLAFTGLGGSSAFSATDFHEFEHRFLGLEGMGTTAVVFTTGGVWIVSNMAYDLTDEQGNLQQAVSKASEIILWADNGIAQWRNSLIVPALDDVYVWAPGNAAEPIGEAIRPLYRSYVRSGYNPGIAAVHGGHYFLPILNGTTWVDTLVCRLDGHPAGWTRWDGHAAQSLAFAERVGATTGQPQLLGLAGQRVTDLSGCFIPAASNKNDADATTHVLTLITRDFAARRVGANLWKYLRARYELEDAASDNPTLTLEYQVGSHSSTWTTVTGSAPESDGTDSFQWHPDIRAQAIRFRIKSNGPTARCVLRSLELWFRPSSKR